MQASDREQQSSIIDMPRRYEERRAIAQVIRARDIAPAVKKSAVKRLGGEVRNSLPILSGRVAKPSASHPTPG
jgi:hypothetical protein